MTVSSLLRHAATHLGLLPATPTTAAAPTPAAKESQMITIKNDTPSILTTLDSARTIIAGRAPKQQPCRATFYWPSPLPTAARADADAVLAAEFDPEVRRKADACKLKLQRLVEAHCARSCVNLVATSFIASGQPVTVDSIREGLDKMAEMLDAELGGAASDALRHRDVAHRLMRPHDALRQALAARVNAMVRISAISDADFSVIPDTVST